MTTSHVLNEMNASSQKIYSLANRGLVGLLIMTFIVSCASDPEHKTALKQAKEGPVEEGVAKLKNSSSSQPENEAYRVDYLRERERVVNQLLLDAVRALNQGDLNEADGTYQRVLTIEPENAQAKLGLSEVERSRRHADAVNSAREAFDKSDFKAAQSALKPVLIENPLDTEAQNLNQQIDAARYTGSSFSQVPELGTAFKKPVSLQFKDTNLKMIFEAISKSSGLNILFDKDIKNDLKATVFVKQASVEDTINLVLMQNQLEKKVLNENTLYIYPATPAKLKEHQDLVIRTFQLTNADVKQIQTLLKTVLKAKDLFINEKTNSIVMRDTPDVVALAAKMIAAQDVNEPEVMLEMEVLEVTHTLATQLGVSYPDQVSVAVDSTIKTVLDWKGLNRSQINISPGGIGVALNLKKTDGDINTLANPRIRVRQHEKAKIHIGSRYPIITNTVTPSTGTPVVTGSIQYIDLGLKLEVEPEIHLDGEVGIKTLLEVSSLGNNVTNGTGADATTAPIVNSRTVGTVLRLKDGETQVLAGLINNNETNDANKVPGLGDIPLFGKLFTNNHHVKDKTELILAITPHIIRNIHQPDAELAAYWSGTDSNVRSRPITVEKMDTMKMESKGASISPSSSTPIQVPKMIEVPLNNQEGATDSTLMPIKPAVTPNVNPAASAAPTPQPVQSVPKPQSVTGSVSLSAGVPRVIPRSSIGNPGSAGMSDATVDPFATPQVAPAQ